MSIPVDNFALQVPTTSLGYNPNTLFTDAPSTTITGITSGTLAPFQQSTPTTSLGFNPTTYFTSISSSDIKNITNGTIPPYNILTLTTTLGYNPNTSFTSVSSSKIIITSSGGYLPNWGARVPSVPLGNLFSTFIYTSNAPITSIGGSATSTQTWYLS